MKKRPKQPTFREIADQVQSEVPTGKPLAMRPNPLREGAVVDDEVRIWTPRRRAALSYPRAMNLLPAVDAMMLDSFPFGERRMVPPEERAAVLETARDHGRLPSLTRPSGRATKATRPTSSKTPTVG